MLKPAVLSIRESLVNFSDAKKKTHGRFYISPRKENIIMSEKPSNDLDTIDELKKSN